MSAIGPDLPPHLLAKRKRKQEEEAGNASATASGANRPSSPSDGEKRRRVIGPAMPPAPLDERPTGSVPTAPSAESAESESSDDDDLGPALPTGGANESAKTSAFDERDEASAPTASASAAAGSLQRDDWMMMPPKQDDLAARMDPTKQRPRGFNTGKSASASHAMAGDGSAWYETAEQKQKRLQDEMMGVSKPASPGPQNHRGSARTAAADTASAKTRQPVEVTRGPSLMEQHKQTSGSAAEDDPSQRAFDREKDMASGTRIGSAQKREMLNKAAGFSSRFSGGSYL